MQMQTHTENTPFLDLDIPEYTPAKIKFPVPMLDPWIYIFNWNSLFLQWSDSDVRCNILK